MTGSGLSQATIVPGLEDDLQCCCLLPPSWLRRHVELLCHEVGCEVHFCVNAIHQPEDAQNWDSEISSDPLYP